MNNNNNDNNNDNDCDCDCDCDCDYDYDNDVMIKLGRASRLWNEPSLRGHKWRNGARFQNKIKMACEQTH